MCSTTDIMSQWSKALQCTALVLLNNKIYIIHLSLDYFNFWGLQVYALLSCLFVGKSKKKSVAIIHDTSEHVFCFSSCQTLQSICDYITVNPLSRASLFTASVFLSSLLFMFFFCRGFRESVVLERPYLVSFTCFSPTRSLIQMIRMASGC